MMWPARKFCISCSLRAHCARRAQRRFNFFILQSPAPLIRFRFLVLHFCSIRSCFDFTWAYFVHFKVKSTNKLYNNQRNAQFFNLFIYLLLPYFLRAFFRGRCTISAVVQVSWVWYQRPGADTIPRRLKLKY
jgi:hypothetical protein